MRRIVMKKADPWKLLRGDEGEQEQGLHLLQLAHVETPDESEIMELGVAYLWLDEYLLALAHFQNAIENQRASTSCFYGMAGVASWCLGVPKEAVSFLQVGLNSKYADTAGLGVKMPLLLFFASVLDPEIVTRVSAESVLQMKLSDPRIMSWPGPIAKLVLGQMSECELRDACVGNRASETLGRNWLCDFYLNLLRNDLENVTVFKQAMRTLADTSQPNWADEDFFLRRMWNEEFFLARFEAGLSA